MPECRVYANTTHLRLAPRSIWTDLSRALWNDKTYETRLQQYGSRASQFVAVDSPGDADLYLLPLTWNYYLEQDAVHLVAYEVEKSADAGHRLVVFSTGDFTANFPFHNVVLFEACSYASRRNSSQNRIFALPAFIPDYLNLYCHGQIQFREKQTVPVVGFCGQAGGSWLDFARRNISLRFRKFLYAIGRRKWEPSPYETTRMRKSILTRLAQSQSVRTDFLIRTRYRSGYDAKQKDPFHPSRLEFVQNILNSDYTLCVRGGGNFSVRFYETLSLGRIPIFVNTDCILPFDDQIDYRQYCIWVEEHEIPFIGEKVLDFHRSLTPAGFSELQKECHVFWREQLSMDGFYAHFTENLSSSLNKAICIDNLEGSRVAGNA